MDPAPCGLTAPDGMHMRQALGLDGVYGSVLEMFVLPNYESFSQYTEDALCGRTYSEWSKEWATCTGTDPFACTGDVAYPNGSVTIGEELFAISKYLNRGNEPAQETSDSYDSVANAFRVEICRTDDEAWYPDLKREQFGALPERITKAYIAAAPTFYRYQSWFDHHTTTSIKDDTGIEDINPKRSSLGCLSGKNPFTSDDADLSGLGCRTSIHIDRVLREAGSAKALARMVNGRVKVDANDVSLTDPTQMPNLSEMLYALMALSVIGHADRTQNAGMCFRNGLWNSDQSSTHTYDDNFCKRVIGDADFSDYTLGSSKLPSEHYTDALKAAATTHACGHNSINSVNIENVHTTQRTYQGGATDNVKEAVIAACRNSLQFGLFEQVRLFGIPDVSGKFVVDPRPESPGRSIAELFYTPWYKEAIQGSLFNDPKARLELFLAYRLASASIVAVAIASVIGYFWSRSTFPLVAQLLAFTGCIVDRRGLKPFLTQPKPEIPLFVAALVGILSGLWVFYVDPSVETIIPITSRCEDWAGPDHWSPSGVYVTNWSSRAWEFILLTEAGLAVMVIFVSVFPAIYSILVTCNPMILMRKKKKTSWSKRNNGIFWLLVILVLIGLLAFAVNAANTGVYWHDRARMGADTTTASNALANDCIATIWAGFWAGAGCGWVRARWALGQAGRLPKFLGGVVAVVFFLVPLIQTPVLVGVNVWETGILETEDQVDTATGLLLEKPINDQDLRTNLRNVIIAMYGGAATLAAILTITYARSTQEVNDGTVAPENALENALQNAEQRYVEEAAGDPNYDEVLGGGIEAPFLSPEVKRLMDLKVLQPMPMHDATGTTGSATLSKRAFGAYRVRGTNGNDQTRYSPMLRVAATF